MEPFKELIQQKYGRQKIYRQAQESLVIAEANNLLKELVVNSETSVQVIYFKEGILTIAVLDNELLTVLAKIKSELLQRLNHKFSNHIVKDWQFLT